MRTDLAKKLKAVVQDTTGDAGLTTAKTMFRLIQDYYSGAPGGVEVPFCSIHSQEPKKGTFLPLGKHFLVAENETAAYLITLIHLV